MKNSLSNFARPKVLVLAMGLAVLLPALAHAEGFKGKFTLTSETHWGTAVLGPGGYEFVLDSISAPTKLVVRSADGKVAALLVSMSSSEAYPVKTNSLKLETRGSKVFVSAVYLADVDTELHFAVPEGKEDVMTQATMKAATMTASAQ